MRRLAVSLTFFLAIALRADAQMVSSPDSAARRGAPIPRPANDSVFRRARRLVSEGNGPAGRAIVDSILRAASPATPAYGEALYWHGALAQTAAEAERDYRRVIVEYPLSFYADEALLSIAELEQARGDRAGALQHLQRFVREYPSNPSRGLAALAAARLAFDQRDDRTACAMLADARASIAPGDVELRNQIAYYRGRCSGVPMAASGPPAGSAAAAQTSVSAPAAVERTSTAPRPATSTAPRPATPPASPPSAARESVVSKRVEPARGTTAAGSYTIQVAAYDTRPDAERLVTKLASRGVRARVSGTSKPFRVRLDFYRTRQEATAEVAALKKRGIVGFVTTEDPRAAGAGARSP